MSRRKNIRIRWWSAASAWLILMLTLTTACHQRPVYSHYESVDVDGWQRDDTLHFVVAQGIKDGCYHETLGLRANLSYPFTALSLIVRQYATPSGASRCDTLMIPLIDADGKALGHGVSHFQYDIPLEDIVLCAGDTLYIDIRHNMKREDLTGITDVGVTLDQTY